MIVDIYIVEGAVCCFEFESCGVGASFYGCLVGDGDVEVAGGGDGGGGGGGGGGGRRDE